MKSKAKYEMHNKKGTWMALCYSGDRASWFTHKRQIKAWAKRHGAEIRPIDVEKLA